MKNLFVVTHAQSIHHIEHKVGGWYDTGLTSQGTIDAAATAERLEALVGESDVEVFSSDLKRASQTAAIIAERLQRTVVHTPDLREISYGVAEGKAQEWLDARYIPAPDEDRLDHSCGIEGAETRRDVAERVFPCLDAIVSRPCQTQIVVTHGFTLTMVIAAWMKLPVESAGFISFPAKSGSITHLRQEDFWRNRSVVSLADVSHLNTTISRR